MELLSAEEAAAELGIAVTTMRHHLQNEHIHAEKIGRDWVITRAALEEFRRNRRKPGRPKSDEEE